MSNNISICGDDAVYIPAPISCSCEDVEQLINDAVDGLFIQKTVTLAVADWSNDEQTVTAEGVTASNAVIVSPAPASQDAYATAGVYCSAQAVDSLTFTKTDSVSDDLTVNILIMNGGAA